MKIKLILTMGLMALGLLSHPLLACKPTIAWGASVSFCQGNSFTLNAFNPNSTYQWSTGDTTSSLTAYTSGRYWVTVTNSCGSTSDTIDVIVDSPIQPNLGADRNICASSQTTLSVPQSNTALYRWSTGASGNSINVSQAGSYWVEVSNACGVFTDTVTLNTESPNNFNLGPDITKCGANSHTLNLPANISGVINWSDGSSASSLNVTKSGKYWVTVTNSCGSLTDTIRIDFLQAQNLISNDTIELCIGGQVTLSANVAASNYQWSNGGTTASISVGTTGLYTLTATTSCGNLTDSVYVVAGNSATVDLGADTTVCDNKPFRLDAGNPGATYRWQSGSSNQKIRVRNSGTYWVGVDNGCGFVYDTIQVTMLPYPDPAIDDTVYICGNTPDTLDAGNWGGQASYLWSDGSTSQQNLSLTAGDHWVEVTSPCGVVRENFKVISESLPQVELRDTTLCTHRYWVETGLPENANYTFKWSNGSTANRISVKSAGMVWVEVTNSCGTVRDSAQINVTQMPRGIRNPDTILKCSGDSVKLRSYNRNGVFYQWSNGANSPDTWVSAPGRYTLLAFNYCRSIRDTVYVVDEQPLNVQLPPDTIICRNSTLPVDVSQINASLSWSDGSTDKVRNLTPGTHILSATNSCGTFTDTIVIGKINGVVPVLKDTIFCSGNSITLDASYKNNNQSFAWNTGDTTATISVSQPGWYSVQISNECFTAMDSCYVGMSMPTGSVDLGADTLFCDGDLVLDPGYFPNTSYLWQDGSQNQTFTASKTGTYYVTVFNPCGSVSDSIYVEVTGPPKLSLGTNVRFCRGSVLHLNAQNPYCNYQWSTGDTSQTVSINSPGMYWVTISNDCGSITDSVEVIVEDPLTQLDLGGDTTICRGDSVLLSTSIPGVRTKWGTGSVAQEIYVKQSGNYWVEVSNSCGRVEDTIHVEVLDIPQFSLGADQKICAQGGYLELRGPDSMQSYLWSTGDTTKLAGITEPGTYWLTVANACFSFTDTVVVMEEYPIDIELGRDTVLCEGSSLNLQVQAGGHRMQWEDGSTSRARSITEDGTYWVRTENSCGVFSDTITVAFEAMPNTDRETVVVCRDDTASFDVFSPVASWEWFDGRRDTVRHFSEQGIYPVFYTNSCGTFRKDVVVDVSNCECPFYVPNAFTPNNDGKNDVFEVVHSCDIQMFNIRVFDRWGNLVYQSDDVDATWDGTFKGNTLPSGVYTYSLHYSWRVYGDKHQRIKTGVINLLR